MDRSEFLKASPPMFKSGLLDRFTRVHHLVPVVIFGPAIAILFASGVERLGFPRSFGLALGGYALWTLAEYWIHRVIFHFEPEEGFGARLHWMVHGVHHAHPNDPLRLVMPPAASVPLALVFYALFWVVLGADRAFAFGAGFLAGYLAYDMIHYALHHHTPRTRLGRWLRELHMRHHFQDDERGFGISAPYWDRVFGTMHVRRGR
jgi:dihydroceramide fatty acyl 2-hydroxylase